MTLLAGIITGTVALVMLYTGMSFNLARVKNNFTRSHVHQIGGLALLNYVLIPVLAYVAISISFKFSGLGLALLTLAVLPCAPLVPSVVTFMDEPPEWAILVFMVFSAISLVFIVLLTVVLMMQGFGQDQAGHGTEEIFRGLGGYLFAVFVPMAAGMAFRRVSPPWCDHVLRFLRPAAGLGLLGALAAFVVVNFSRIKAVAADEFVIILLFNVCCIALVFPFKASRAEIWVSRLLTTGFRNIALALPFSMIVLGRTDVPVYIVVYGILAMITCYLAVFCGKAYQGWLAKTQS